MPRAMKRRTGRSRFAPIQVYVSEQTAPMWAEVQKLVEQEQKKDGRYSVSQFINEAVRSRLDQMAE